VRYREKKVQVIAIYSSNVTPCNGYHMDMSPEQGHELDDKLDEDEFADKVPAKYRDLDDQDFEKFSSKKGWYD